MGWPQVPDHALATTQERIQTIHERFINCPPARGAAREHLIAVASVLFPARGFAAVSMQEIADAVGVTKAALYYHFGSKEDLFEAVTERAINEFWEGIIVASRGDGTLREVLHAMIAYVKTLSLIHI